MAHSFPHLALLFTPLRETSEILDTILRWAAKDSCGEILQLLMFRENGPFVLSFLYLFLSLFHLILLFGAG